jgi:hypothetical protein
MGFLLCFNTMQQLVFLFLSEHKVLLDMHKVLGQNTSWVQSYSYGSFISIRSEIKLNRSTYFGPIQNFSPFEPTNIPLQRRRLRSSPPALPQPPREPWSLPDVRARAMDAPRRPPRAMAAPRCPPPSRHQHCRVVTAICTPCCHHRVVAALPAACAFHTGAACTLSTPTAMSNRLGEFCSDLLKFHSNPVVDTYPKFPNFIQFGGLRIFF